MKPRSEDFFHQPVLLHEVIEFIKVIPGKLYLDCTVGGGGHTAAILKKGGKVFGLDQDPEAITFANQYLTTACPNTDWQIIQGNFSNLKAIAYEYHLEKPSGILFDLGASLHQLKGGNRGFSFFLDEPLDMRMDPSLGVTAADLVNGLYEKELTQLFEQFGEEPLSTLIAKQIVKERKFKPIKTTSELSKIATFVYKRCYRQRSFRHPATKIFMALRIAVNNELNNLEKGLEQAKDILDFKGRLVVISFQGLEDKITKNYFKKGKDEGWWEILTKKPIQPQPEELEENHRARSAKLRAVQKK